MKARLVWAAAWVCCELACSAAGGQAQAKELHAPGYYIAVNAARDYEGAIRVRGASNLPTGAEIGLVVEELAPEIGRKPLNELVCVAVAIKRDYFGLNCR